MVSVFMRSKKEDTGHFIPPYGLGHGSRTERYAPPCSSPPLYIYVHFFYLAPPSPVLPSLPLLAPPCYSCPVIKCYLVGAATERKD